MRNPLKSEADAFQLVLLAIGYFGLIVLAAAINRWLGVAVFALLTAAAVAWIIRARREPPVRTAPLRRSAPGERRILVIANETVGGETLREIMHFMAEVLPNLQLDVFLGPFLAAVAPAPLVLRLEHLLDVVEFEFGLHLR